MWVSRIFPLQIKVKEQPKPQSTVPSRPQQEPSRTAIVGPTGATALRLKEGNPESFQTISA